MYSEALGYLAGGKCLDRKLDDFGQSAVILKTLALEILLKSVCVLEGVEPKRHSHDYKALLSTLPSPLAAALLEDARICFGPEADFADFDLILDDLRRAFSQARYGYEVNADLDEPALAGKGAKWLAEGGPLDQADFRFRPMERDALVFALAKHIQTRLGLPERDVLA
jgi:hypothetical protein